MYNKQYVIARQRARIPESYAVHELAGWWIGVARDLDVVHVALPNTRALCLVGHPIDLGGSLERLRETGNVEDIYELAGSYIALIDTGSGVALQLDAAGTLPAVYAPEHHVIAASPGLIAECPDDAELRAAFPIERDAFFPFGLTPKRGVLRLLPNHRLSLDTMSVARHWPIALPEGRRPPAENVAFIAQRLRKLLAIVGAEHALSLPLTAGYDSRALLACMPADADISSFTSTLDRDALEDARVAAQLAAAVELPYRAAQYVAPSDEERQLWLESTGHCVGGRVTYNFKTVAAHTADRVIVGGLAGEVGRAFYSSGIARSTSVTAPLLLRKLGLPLHPSGVRAATRWLAGLPKLDALQILDLLYIEVRLGCWAGPQLIAPGPCRYRLVPFAQRAIFEHALDVPYALRRKDFIPAAIVRRERPELASIPYNAAKRSLRRRITGLIGRVIRHMPDRAKSRINQVLQRVA
jgi:hypothetical protein